MPTSVDKVQPVDGATPPEVFSRWMKVVTVSLSPPVGPSWAPTTSSRSQAIAPGSTKAGSEEEWLVRLAPDGARVPGVLPRGANHVSGHDLWISVILKRVGAEEVGDDLLIVVVEQGGLRREECPGEAGGGTHRTVWSGWARQQM